MSRFTRRDAVTEARLERVREMDPVPRVWLEREEVESPCDSMAKRTKVRIGESRALQELAGRSRVKREQVGWRVDEDLIPRMKKTARAYDCSLADLLSVVLRDWLDENEAGV